MNATNPTTPVIAQPTFDGSVQIISNSMSTLVVIRTTPISKFVKEIERAFGGNAYNSSQRDNNYMFSLPPFMYTDDAIQTALEAIFLGHAYEMSYQA